MVRYFGVSHFSIQDFVMLKFLLTMQKSQNRNSRNPEIETLGVTISENQAVSVQTDPRCMCKLTNKIPLWHFKV
jgi:hypothetical protein